MNMLKIGLTGGIASGKSTVAKMISNYHIPIVDADKIARQVVEPGEPVFCQIIETFGEDLILPDGNLNRKKLGDMIFNNKEKRETLNQMIHPKIGETMMRKVKQYEESHQKSVVLDIPLLFESKLTHLVDKILLVYVNDDLQTKRLMERNHLTLEEAKSRITSQLPLFQKKAMSDYIIDNSGSREETQKQVHDVLKLWRIL